MSGADLEAGEPPYHDVLADLRDQGLEHVGDPACLGVVNPLLVEQADLLVELLEAPSTIFSIMASGFRLAELSPVDVLLVVDGSSGISSRFTARGSKAAICIATCLQKAWNSSVLATKSVSQFTSTSTPIRPPLWR